MLRIALLILLLANGAYWAWTQGALAVLGFAPVGQREPQRVTQQIRPEALRVLSVQELRKLDGPPTQVAATSDKGAECLQAGLFDERQTASLRTSLGTALPSGSWQLESGIEPARWLIYMGKYPSAEALTRKKSELQQIGVKYEDVPVASLQLGLSLGSFGSQTEANQTLGSLAQRGVRTARVVAERAELRGQSLKLPAVDEALRGKLDALKPLLFGKALKSCS